MTKLQIKAKQIDDFAPAILRFAKTEFPKVATRTHSDVLEALTDAILATGQIRLGPKPPIESIVAMRTVITDYMKKGLPIPFMVPWGSEKPDGSGIDIAELAAMKTISCLQDRIIQHYEPGATFNLCDENTMHNELVRGISGQVVSAGFVEITGSVECDSTQVFARPYGKSVSLGIGSRPEDRTIIEQVLNGQDPNFD